jgi:hypothetical protein
MERYNKFKTSPEINHEAIEICKVFLLPKQAIAFEVSIAAKQNDLLESAKIAVAINPEPTLGDKNYEPHEYKASIDGYDADYRESFW